MKNIVATLIFFAIAMYLGSYILSYGSIAVIVKSFGVSGVYYPSVNMILGNFAHILVGIIIKTLCIYIIYRQARRYDNAKEKLLFYVLSFIMIALMFLFYIMIGTKCFKWTQVG